jgi:hypothetical protein
MWTTLCGCLDFLTSTSSSLSLLFDPSSSIASSLD